MPSAAEIQAVYDFENILEAAIASVFEAEEFNVLTRASVGQFQEQRPRLEIVVQSQGGAATGNRGASKALQGLTNLGTPPTTVVMCAFYSARALFALVTNGTEDDKKVHAAYLYTARWIIDTLSPRVNYQLLTNHAVNMPIIPGATVTAFEKDKGYWISNFSAEFTFSIVDGAWSNLTN
jgi:hypothetical protein